MLLARGGLAAFSMLFMRSAPDVRVRDIVLHGNKSSTTPPDETDGENIGCGFLALATEGQTGLSLCNVIVRDHHGSGIRITGPTSGDTVEELDANEVEVIGCQVRSCDSRGIVVARATRARISGNVIASCKGAGIQVASSRGAVIDGNVIEKIVRTDDRPNGNGIAVANAADYVIVNNVVSNNERWGIVASGSVGLFPPDHPMSQRFVVANNICRANGRGGITIDPTVGIQQSVIQDSFATVASNVCVANTGHGIHATHAGYLAVRGNICDSNTDNGIAINSSRHAVVADNVMSRNGNYGIAYRVRLDVS